MLPIENYNNVCYSYGSYNELQVSGLVPFNPMFSMKVVIQYPIIPDYNKDKKKEEAPNINLDDCLTFLPEFKPLIEEQGDIYFLALALFSFTKSSLDYSMIKDDNLYKYLFSMFLGHYLKQHLRDFKDEVNRASNNNENVEKNYYFNDMIKLLEKGEKDEFLLTSYGSRFVNIFDTIGGLSLKGGYGINGRYVK